MTQLTEHAKTILRAIADGKVIETNFQLDKWEMLGLRSALGHLLNHPESVRIKPEVRSINGVEIPAPHLGGSYLVRISFENGVHQTAWGWTNGTDRDTAYQAVVDALEGKSK